MAGIPDPGNGVAIDMAHRLWTILRLPGRGDARQPAVSEELEEMTVPRIDRMKRRASRSATRSFILTKEPREEREVAPGVLTMVSFLVAGVTLLYLASSLILAAGS